jgi:Beta-propeller repeat
MKITFKYRAILIILTLAILTNNAKSQTDFIWGKIFGSEKDDYIFNHVNDEDGNLYIAGKTTGTIGTRNFGKNDGFLTKIDSSGSLLWSRQFGTPQEEDIHWCAIDKSVNIYITGSTTGDLDGKNAGKEDIFVVKYDTYGKMLWSKQFGTSESDVARGIYADNTGNIYVTGDTGGKLGQNSFGKNDCFVMKLDSNGNQLFVTQFGTPGDDYSYSVTGGPGKDIFVCGSTWGELAGKNKGLIDGFTGQFTENGAPVKFNQFGSEGFDIAEIINVDKENNIYVGGSTSGNFGSIQIGEGDAFLIKLNEKGDILWNNQFGTKNNDGLRSIAINSDISDNILVSGILNLPPANAFVRMYTKDGKMLWERIFKGCSGKDVKFDNKGNCYHVGLTGVNVFGNKIGNTNFYVAKMSLDKEYLNYLEKRENN